MGQVNDLLLRHSSKLKRARRIQETSDPRPFDNLEADAAPTATNDASEGYSIRSLWYNTVTDYIYICVDNTTGAAVWVNITRQNEFDRLRGDPTFTTTSATYVIVDDLDYIMQRDSKYAVWVSMACSASAAKTEMSLALFSDDVLKEEYTEIEFANADRKLIFSLVDRVLPDTAGESLSIRVKRDSGTGTISIYTRNMNILEVERVSDL